MTPSNSLFGPEFVKNLLAQTLAASEVMTKSLYRMMWDSLLLYLKAHWISVLIFLAVILAIALFEYLSTGSWRMLGSVLYHYLYFGILFIIGLVKGPDVFISEYFEIACAIILYPICYWTVRVILTESGIRKRY